MSRNSLLRFAQRHADARIAVEHWFKIAKAADWNSMQDVQAAFPKAKILNRERARFEIQGGDYRLIVAFRFDLQLAFVKFVGSHAEYDRVDALTVSQF